MLASETKPTNGGVGPDAMVDRIRAKKLRILVVDDDEQFRAALAFNLKETFGAQVTAVSTGYEAISKLEEGQSFDLILLDLMMPGMNGIETFRRLCENGSLDRVVIMSAHPDSPMWLQAEQLEVELIEKPIEEDRFLNILAK